MAEPWRPRARDQIKARSLPRVSKWMIRPLRPVGMNAPSQQRKPAHASWGRKPEIMETTITQNGALFALQRSPAKRNYGQHHHRQIASPNKTISTLRTSVGDFVFRQTPLGCYLELSVGTARSPPG